MAKKEEEKVFNEFLQEAVKDAKKPKEKGVYQGVAGIIVGIIGLFMPLGINLLFAAIGGGLAVYANKHGSRTLAIIAVILALLNFVGLLIGIKF